MQAALEQVEGCEVVEIDYAAKTATVNVPVDTDPTALIEALLDPDEAVRVQALLALSAQRGHLPAATTSRILELSHDSAINVRAAACSALAACGGTAAITRLNQLTTDASPWVGHCATNALKGLRRANMGELTFDAIGEGVNG